MDLKSALLTAYANNPEFLNKNLGKTSTASLDTITIKTKRHTGRHALKPYLGIVEFPPSRGGGACWLKSAVALRKYEDLNYKVMWL